MRLLMLNPNTSASVTRLLETEARCAAQSTTTVTTMTATFGVPYIETDAEAVIGGCAVLEMLGAVEGHHDVAIIAAFGDPGLAAAKSACDIPVIGLSEAAFLMAAASAESFGIVAISPRMQTWYRRAIDHHHMGPRFGGFRFLSPLPINLASIQTDRAQELAALGASLVNEKGVGTVIYAGAPLAGFVRAYSRHLDFPALDGTAAAVHLAEAVGNMARSGSTVRPARIRGVKTTKGLSDAVARLF